MKELTYSKKLQVIKLFLTGLSYDDIVQKTSIAKGSVVNIINEFKDGYLSLPPEMTEYIDELRHLVVDMKKHGATVPQLMSCVKLDAKLQEMGVVSEKVEQWLDICQDIASPTVPSTSFVQAALELAQLSSDSGSSYGDLIADYNSKASRLKVLDREINQNEEQLNQIKQNHKEEKEQTTKELDSLTQAIATAQDTFHKQKDDLKSQLNEYLMQHGLSWKKVNTAVTLFDTELGKSDLSKREIEQLSERIRHVGSLVKLIKTLEEEKGRLQFEVTKLASDIRSHNTSVQKLKNIADGLCDSISINEQRLGILNAELESKGANLEELEQITSQYTHDLYISRLIIDFLFVPNSISDYDLNRLVSLMVSLRQNRLGLEPKQIKDATGNVICECQIPRLYGNTELKEADIDNARMAFARLLTPLVQDKFVSRFDYNLAETRHETSKAIAVAEAILKERSRHLF